MKGFFGSLQGTMSVPDSHESRHDALAGRALAMLRDRVAVRTADELKRALVVAWLAGGTTVAARCVQEPGPLRNAWRRGDDKTLAELALEFTYPMMSRWFRYIKGTVGGSPADRLRTRRGWMRYLLSRHLRSGLERRLAIRIRLDSLFTNDCEANLMAEVSPGALGLVSPNSLSVAEAAALTEAHLSASRRTGRAATVIRMDVMKGAVSVSEPFMLGMRALGICGRLQRFNRHWDEIAFTPVRPTAELARLVPSRVWSLSGALRLAAALDLGMAAMLRSLGELPVPERPVAPPHL